MKDRDASNAFETEFVRPLSAGGVLNRPGAAADVRVWATVDDTDISQSSGMVRWPRRFGRRGNINYRRNHVTLAIHASFLRGGSSLAVVRVLAGAASSAGVCP